jgi:glycerol-3-phosphate dehydrogenase
VDDDGVPGLATAVEGVIVRDPRAAARERHDLIVVGGGIYGVTLALEAARRGLRPCLVERDDFGGATSWNSLRIVHGGLRYLQSLDLRRLAESVAERSRLLAEFPDLVFPLACLMPLYGRGLRRPLALRLALAANELLSRPAASALPADRRLPAGRVLDPAATRRLFPAARAEGLAGGALWHDATMPDSPRLLIEMLRWAASGGAVALNYVEARGLLRDGDAVAGIVARDRVGDEDVELRAPVVVNCAGPWSTEVARRLDRDHPELFFRSIAFNAWIDRDAPAEVAVAVEPAGGGRTYFLVPFKGRVIAGTYHAPWSGGPRAEVDDALLDAFLADLAASIPGFAPSRRDVLRVYAGLLPARRPGTDAIATRETVLHHADADGPQGLFSVSGVKWTTARAVAEKTLRAIHAWRGTPLPGYGRAERPAPATVPPAARMREMLAAQPVAAAAAAGRLAAEESVVTIEDLLLRRTDWGMHPEDERALGAELGRRIPLPPAAGGSDHVAAGGRRA